MKYIRPILFTCFLFAWTGLLCQSSSRSNSDSLEAVPAMSSIQTPQKIAPKKLPKKKRKDPRILLEKDSLNAKIYCLSVFYSLKEHMEKMGTYSGHEPKRILREQLLNSSDFKNLFASDTISIEDDLLYSGRDTLTSVYIPWRSYLRTQRILFDSPDTPKVSYLDPSFEGLYAFKDESYFGMISFDRVLSREHSQDTLRRIIYIETNRLTERDSFKIYKIKNFGQQWDPPRTFNWTKTTPEQPHLVLQSPTQTLFNPYKSHWIRWQYNLDEILILSFESKDPRLQGNPVFEYFSLSSRADSFLWKPNFSFEKIDQIRRYPFDLVLKSESRDSVVQILRDCWLMPPFYVMQEFHTYGNFDFKFKSSKLHIQWRLLNKYDIPTDSTYTIALDLFQNGDSIARIVDQLELKIKGDILTGSYEWAEAQKYAGEDYQIRVSIPNSPNELSSLGKVFRIQERNPIKGIRKKIKDKVANDSSDEENNRPRKSKQKDQEFGGK